MFKKVLDVGNKLVYAGFMPAPLRTEPPAIHTHAIDNLRFIRETMECASSFTAVPGWELAVVGGVAFLAALAATWQPDPARWLAIWLTDAALSFAILFWAMFRKARSLRTELLSRPNRRFALCLGPPLLVGALLTPPLYLAGLSRLLPGVWLLSFGAGVSSGGALSVKIVPVMGWCFMLAGTAALVAPAAWGNAVMALGFGGLNLVFGAIIARRHGG